jgi:hypothetical protein
MKTLFNRLWNADPSKFIGRLASFVAGLLVVLLYVVPFLANMDPRLKGAAAFVIAVVIPKLQAILTALRAYKPSTVDELQAVAHEQGQAVALAHVEAQRNAQIAAEKVAADKAAKKAKRKAAKAEPVRKMSESSTSKVPKK